MKKVVSALLATLVLGSVVACGSSRDASSDETQALGANGKKGQTVFEVPASAETAAKSGVHKWVFTSHSRARVTIQGLDASGEELLQARNGRSAKPGGSRVEIRARGGVSKIDSGGQVVTNTLDDQAIEALRHLGRDMKENGKTVRTAYDACSDATFYYYVQLAAQAEVCIVAPLTTAVETAGASLIPLVDACVIATSSTAQAALAMNTACNTPPDCTVTGCQLGLVCWDGTCQQPLPNGGGNVPQSCFPGGVNNCPLLQSCVNGQCTYDSCKIDSECPLGQVCLGTCQYGVECTTDDQCVLEHGNGWSCSGGGCVSTTITYPTGGYTSPTTSTGTQGCVGDWECSADELCDFGVCGK